MSETLESFLKLFSFDKKSELIKYCKDLVINADDFVNFIIACEAGLVGFAHQIHYRDFRPDHLNPTDEDLAALSANPVGPLQPAAQKAVRKMAQMFEERKYLVGHIFYTRDLSQWHFFQFDQRDITDERGNHWKGGAHVHFLNWLWPNYDAKTLWENFASGKDKMDGSLHVRYFDADLQKRKRS